MLDSMLLTSHIIAPAADRPETLKAHSQQENVPVHHKYVYRYEVDELVGKCPDSMASV